MKIQFASALASLALMTACTGNPREGGIFWSQSLAQERQDHLANLNIEETAINQSLVSKNEELRKSYNYQKSQLSKAKAKLKESQSVNATPEEITALELRIAELEKDVAARRKLLIES